LTLLARWIIVKLWRLNYHLLIRLSFSRYLGEYDGITKEDYENAVKIAKDCLMWVE
jgi:hypothetical protein